MLKHSPKIFVEFIQEKIKMIKGKTMYNNKKIMNEEEMTFEKANIIIMGKGSVELK